MKCEKYELDSDSRSERNQMTNQWSVVLGDEHEMKYRPSCDKHFVQAMINADAVKVENRARRPYGTGSVYRNKTGKWTAEFNHRKARVYVGSSYTSPEEAEAALHKRKQELDSVSRVGVLAKECELDQEDVKGQVIISRPRGVYQRKSGRWFAEIGNPVMKKRGSVGTYDTAEEALEVLNGKRREYAEMKRMYKQLDGVREYNVALAGKIESNGDQGGGERQANGDCIIQVPSSSSFVGNQEFDTSNIINAYGELVGEFCRMDDELWFVQ